MVFIIFSPVNLLFTKVIKIPSKSSHIKKLKYPPFYSVSMKFDYFF